MNQQTESDIRRKWGTLFGLNIIVLGIAVILLIVNLGREENLAAREIAVQERESIVADASISAAEVSDIVGRVEAAEDNAKFYLSIFESISFWVSVIGVMIVVLGVFAAVIGVSNFREMQENLEKTRKDLEGEQIKLSQKLDIEVAKLSRYETQIQSALSEVVKVSIYETQIQSALIDMQKQYLSNAQLTASFQKEVEFQLARILQTYQNNQFALTLVSLAERDLRMYNYSSATNTIERALEIDPNNVLGHYYLGIILPLSKDLEGSRKHLEKALELDPDFLHAKAALGFTTRRIGEVAADTKERDILFDMAEKLILGALLDDNSLSDFDGESWYGSLAGLYRRQGKYKEAEIYYEKAAHITPFSSYPLGNQARLVLQAGFGNVVRLYMKVKQLARREISLDIGNYWGYSDLLAAQLVLGENDDAIRTLANLLDAIPDDVVDVLPRIIETVNDILVAPKFDGDKRDKSVIEQVKSQLEQAANQTSNSDRV